MMKAIYLILLGIVTEIAAAQYHSICPTKLVKWKEGSDVTLQCFLRPAFSVSAHTVEWKRDDLKKVVHLYRHRKDDPDPQMGQYRNRTNLNHEDLGRGVLDLRLSLVRPSDSGQYRCNVPKLEASCIITLTVVQKNQTNIDDSGLTQSPQKDVSLPNNHGAEQIKAVSIVWAAILALSLV